MTPPLVPESCFHICELTISSTGVCCCHLYQALNTGISTKREVVGAHTTAKVSVLLQPLADEKDKKKQKIQTRLLHGLKRFFILFILPEYKVRTMVVVVCWCFGAMVYYGLALNANNIKYVTHVVIVYFLFSLNLSVMARQKHLVTDRAMFFKV